MSISSMKIIPASSALRMASSFTSSMSMSREASSSSKIFLASFTVTFLFLGFLGIMPLSISCKFIMETSSIIPAPIIPTLPGPLCLMLMSIFRFSSSPFFIFSRKTLRVRSFSSSSSTGVPLLSRLAGLPEGALRGGIKASRRPPAPLFP